MAEAAFEYPLTAYDLDQFLPCLDGNTLLVVEPFQGLENGKALNYLNSALGLSSAEKIYLAVSLVMFCFNLVNHHSKLTFCWPIKN